MTYLVVEQWRLDFAPPLDHVQQRLAIAMEKALQRDGRGKGTGDRGKHRERGEGSDEQVDEEYQR